MNIMFFVFFLDWAGGNLMPTFKPSLEEGKPETLEKILCLVGPEPATSH